MGFAIKGKDKNFLEWRRTRLYRKQVNSKPLGSFFSKKKKPASSSDLV